MPGDNEHESPGEQIGALATWTTSTEQSVIQAEDEVLALVQQNDRTEKLATEALHQARCLGRVLRQLTAQAVNQGRQLV